MASISNLNINPNYKGINGESTFFSNTIYSAQLAATTATALTVPGSSGMGANAQNVTKYMAKFSYEAGKNVFVANNATAAAAAGASFAAATSILNPAYKEVKFGDVLSFFATAQAYVTVEFFAVQN